MRAIPLVLLLAACAHRPSAPPAAPASTPPPAPAPAATTTAPAPRPLPERFDHAPRAATPAGPDALAPLRGELEALLRAQAEALWVAWTRGERADLAATYSGREALFSAERVREVGAAMRAASGDDRRALQLLYGFLVGEHLARQAGASAATLARAQAANPVRWHRSAVPPERVASLLALEPERGQREELHRAWAEAAAGWTPASDAHVAALEGVARSLGLPSLLALAGEVRGASPEALASLADEVLAATDGAYEEAVESLARAELGIALGDLRGADAPRLFRAGGDASMFPAARAFGDVRAVFDELGLGVVGRRGVTLDLEARPRKDPRALALPVAVPDDVRLSFAPAGGVSELRALLHETAATSFYSRIESPRFEFRRLGNVVGETWAQLFEELAGDPAWLLERTKDTEHHLAPVVRAAAARRLHTAREAAVRLLLEVRRPADPAARRRDAAALLERAWGRPVGDEEVTLALATRDPLLQSANTLRAAVLAAQAESFLSGGAGPRWWTEPRAGTWLAHAFAEGSRLFPDALAGALGFERLDAAPLAERARARTRWADAPR